MACLKKLDSDLSYDCTSLAELGGTGEIDEAIIINSSDIATVSETVGVGTITMATGKKGFVANSVNNSIMYQDAIKVNDTTPPGEDQSVIIKVLKSDGVPEAYRVKVRQLVGGNYRIAMGIYSYFAITHLCIPIFTLSCDRAMRITNDLFAPNNNILRS